MATPDGNRAQNIGNGVDHIPQNPEPPFLSGLKQRLLSFIFKGIWDEEDDPSLVSFTNIDGNLQRLRLVILFVILLC